MRYNFNLFYTSFYFTVNIESARFSMLIFLLFSRVYLSSHRSAISLTVLAYGCSIFNDLLERMFAGSAGRLRHDTRDLMIGRSLFAV